jgi:hemerythrin-like domain-containing protein
MADDLISALTEDHLELNGLLSELEVLSGDEHLRRLLTDQLIIEVVRHSVAEECYLYPLCRARLPGGDRIADEGRAEHRQIERILKQLEAGGLPEEHVGLLLSWLTGDMRAHMESEEEEIFVLLAEHVSREELRELGVKARRSKAAAPSRPVPSSGPLLTMILRSGAGLVERVREYLCEHRRVYPCRVDPSGEDPGR